MLSVFKQAYKHWRTDHADQLSAALSFFMIFSIAPLFVIAISIAGFILDKQSVSNLVFSEVRGMIGDSSASFLQEIVDKSFQPANNFIALGFGILLLFFGASGIFNQLRNALGSMWGKTLRYKKSWLWRIQHEALPFLLIFLSGIALLAAFILRAGLTILIDYLQFFLPFPVVLTTGMNILFSVFITTLFFTLLYHLLIPVSIRWRKAFAGAFYAAIFLEIAKFGFDLYIRLAGIASVYGVAGSLVVILLWIFVSAALFFYGAEIVKVLHLQKPVR